MLETKCVKNMAVFCVEHNSVCEPLRASSVSQSITRAVPFVGVVKPQLCEVFIMVGWIKELLATGWERTLATLH